MVSALMNSDHDNKQKQKCPPSEFWFEEIEHTADTAIRVRGESLERLLGNAALAMAGMLCEESSLSDECFQEPVEIFSGDREELLVEWLNELVFMAETKSFVFRRFDCEMLSETHLKAVVHGKKAAVIEVYIKAVTYHNLQIAEINGSYEATVVFDT